MRFMLAHRVRCPVHQNAMIGHCLHDSDRKRARCFIAVATASVGTSCTAPAAAPWRGCMLLPAPSLT